MAHQHRASASRRAAHAGNRIPRAVPSADGGARGGKARLRATGRRVRTRRPSYPPEAIEWIAQQLALLPGHTVLDVGAGTGKLTRALMPFGAQVIAIEPVAGMRGVLERELPSVRSLDGTADTIPLASASADAILVGQAFHWFDARPALGEFHRVLRPAGRLALVWNVRDRSQPLQRVIDEITEPLRGDTPSQARRDWPSVVSETQQFAQRDVLRLPFELEVAPETFVDRIMSISFIAALDAPEREEVLAAVKALATEHPEAWAYVCEAYVFERIGER